MTFWRWVGLVLVVAIATVYVMGRRLPFTHHAVAEGIVQASQDRVWRLVDDTATQSQWRTGLVKVTPIQNATDGRCWIEANRSAILTVCQVEEVPESRLVVRIVGQTSYGGRWIYTLQPAGPHATSVSMVEDGWIASPLKRFLGHYILGEDTNVRKFLHDLQAEAVRQQ